MSKAEERIINAIGNNGVLMQFLGADNVERLKKEITDAIIQQVIDDLHDYHEYIICPDDIAEDITKDIMESVRKEIKPKAEKVLCERIMAKFGLEYE